MSLRASFLKFQTTRTWARHVTVLMILTGSGVPIQAAARSLVRQGHDDFCDLLRKALIHADAGKTFECALEEVALLGSHEGFVEFAQCLALCHRFGSSVQDGLSRLRESWVQKADQILEEHIQKVPIQMIMPLAVCFLPIVLALFTWKGLADVLRLVVE